MKKIIFLFPLLAGCSSGDRSFFSHFDRSFELDRHLRPGEVTTFSIDPAFSSTEKPELEGAASDLTNEGFQISLVSSSVTSDGQIVRGSPTWEQLPPGGTGIDRKTLDVYVDADAYVYPEDLRINVRWALEALK